MLTAVFLVGWIAMNRALMREYGGVVKENLRVSWPDADKLVLDRVDVDAAKLVFDTLESRNQSTALYAMNLLDLVRKEGLSPELKDLLNAGNSRVRAGSLDTLLDAGGGPLFQDWDDSIADGGLDAEIREILALDVYRDVMRTRFEAWAEHPDGGRDTEAMEAAKALGRVPAGSPLASNLRPLLRSGSPEVLRYALESAGKLGRREFVPLILPHLGSPLLADAAAAALLAYGDRIAGMLGDTLADPASAAAERRAVPGVLARLATPRAAAALQRALRRGDGAVRAEVIDAMVRIRAAHPETAWPAETVALRDPRVGRSGLRLDRTAGRRRDGGRGRRGRSGAGPGFQTDLRPAQPHLRPCRHRPGLAELRPRRAAGGGLFARSAGTPPAARGQGRRPSAPRRGPGRGEGPPLPRAAPTPRPRGRLTEGSRTRFLI